MTRLFVRFYLGVILNLFVAWLIQTYVFRASTETENISVVEAALSGAAFSARDDLVEGGQANFDATLDKVRARFAYPVKISPKAERPMSTELSGRIDRGEAILIARTMVVAIPSSDLLVELGPLPQFAGPTRRNVLLGLGSVFLLAAAAIAILLRPIAKQFRTIERTALAIADGDLSARIEEGRTRRDLPIAGAFNKMAARVETLLRSQRELLQAVSHELRTPLARIKFATELVRTADDDEERRQHHINSIDDATDKLDDLVGELLDYARLDEGTEAAIRETISANEIIAEAIAIYAPLHPTIQFSSSAPSPMVELTTYRRGLLRAVGNLVSNAGKYAKNQVNISVLQTDGQVQILVDDDGNGIAEADRELVFEPFKRLSNDTQPGTGLGLALVRRICHRIHGDVSVSSSPLGGARFRLRIPSSSN